eukprot:tig00020830_g14420.t1
MEMEEEEPLREWWGVPLEREDIDMLEALNRDLQPDFLEKKRLMLKPERGFGALFELEGVLVDTKELQRDAWLKLADEEQEQGNNYVFAAHERQLEKMLIMRNEQFIFEVLDWTGDPREIMSLVERKEEIFRDLLKEKGLELIPGAKQMLDILKDNEVPCALGSLQPRKSVEAIIEATGLQSYFKALVSGADFLRLKPSPHMYLTMAKEVERAPMFCCVFDHTPVGIEAARAGQMKCVVVSSTHPPYALTGADVIVDRLDELSVLLFKRIFVY